MKHDTKVILLLGISLIFLLMFSDGIVTLITLNQFSDWFRLGFVYDDGLSSDDFDAGELLNCLHGGACPSGVYYDDGSTDADIIDDVGTSSSSIDIDGIFGTSSSSDSTDSTSNAVIENATPDDTDGDGILDDVDECVNEPELVNGFLDGDGCPESVHGDNVVTQLPDTNVVNVLLDAPELQTQVILPEPDLPSDVNLNETVNQSFIIYYIIILIITITLILLLLMKYKKI